MKKLGDREKKYVHMLNATLCATGRANCCLLETYQVTHIGLVAAHGDNNNEHVDSGHVKRVNFLSFRSRILLLQRILCILIFT